jgi:hypothetical protein
VDKANVHIKSRILVSLQKEGNLVIFDNTGEPGGLSVNPGTKKANSTSQRQGVEWWGEEGEWGDISYSYKTLA